MKSRRQKKSHSTPRAKCAASKKRSATAALRSARRKSRLRKTARARYASRHHPRSPAKIKSESSKKSSPDFPSLDFPGRRTLQPHELADRVGCSVHHIHDLIFEGQLPAIDISGGSNRSRRRSIRIPLESWQKFLADRLT